MLEPDIRSLLLFAHNTPAEVNRMIEHGTVNIYEYDDYMLNFDEYTIELEPRSAERLRHELESTPDGYLEFWDMDVVTWNYQRYIIEYFL